MYKDLMKIPFYNEIKRVIIEGEFDAWFVGGCVRDIVLGRDVHDVDMVCFSHDYRDFAKALKKGLPSVWVEFKDNVRLVRGRVEIDISKPRGATLEADLKERDFTINNLAVSTGGEIAGDFGDIDKRVIRHVSDDTFTDDPLRILRTFRFKAQLGFDIAPETLAKVQSEKHLLPESAAERIFQELEKLFTGSFAAEAFELAAETEIFALLTDGAVYDELYVRAAAEKRGFLFFLSALFYIVDSDEQDVLAQKLNLPNALKKSASKTAYFALELENVLSDAIALRKLIYAYPDEVDNGVKLYELASQCRHECPAVTEENVFRVMKELKDVDFEMPERVNGFFLQELGISPGPLMGEVIKEVKPKLASGELVSLADAEKYIIERYL